MSDRSDRPKSLEDLKQRLREEVSGPPRRLQRGSAGATGVDAESSEGRGYEAEEEATPEDPSRTRR